MVPEILQVIGKDSHLQLKLAQAAGFVLGNGTKVKVMILPQKKEIQIENQDKCQKMTPRKAAIDILEDQMNTGLKGQLDD